MRKFQSRYMLGYGRPIHDIPSFTKGSHIFLDNPSLGTEQGASAESRAKHMYNKLQARTGGPYEINSA